MRTQDIKLGEFYRVETSPTMGYAKPLEILKPKPTYRCKTDLEKQIKFVVEKNELRKIKDKVK